MPEMLDPREVEAIREQARQGADISSMKDDIKEIRRSIESLTKETRELTKFVDETKGGKKWLWAIISAAAAIGTTVGAVINWKLTGGG